MKKLVSIFAAVFMVSMVAGSTGYNGPSDKPHIMNQGDNQAPNNTGPGNISLPDLPGQASDTAKKAISNIQKFFQGGVENLGNSLSQVLGGENE